MQIAGKPLRVKLKVDLTKYDSRCKISSRGYTLPDVKLSIWGFQDRFVAVEFDNGSKLDVLWDSLEVINKNGEQK